MNLAHAEAILLSQVIENISQNNIRIIYSSDFLAAEKIEVDREISSILELKSYLENQHELTINNIMDNVHLVQKLEPKLINNNSVVIIGEVIDVATRDTLSNVKIFDYQSHALTTSNKNGFFITIAREHLPIELKAALNGYASSTLTVMDKDEKDIYQVQFNLKQKPYELEKISVTTSHHDFKNLFNANQKIITRDELELAPNFGNDAARAVSNLPGLTSNGITARHHVRGGKQSESQVILNGLNLRNPYHFKDFFSIFSSINLSYIEDLSLYSGVFPAKYGSYISSVMDVQSTTADDTVIQTSLGTLNAFITASGQLKNSDHYIISLRSGGDLLRSGLIDLETGEPSYNDAFLNYQHTLTNGSLLTANVLYNSDDINLNTPIEDEVANAKYNDNNYWLQWEQDINENWSNSIMLFHQKNKTDRNGFLEDNLLKGSLLEIRRSDISGLRNEVSYDKQNNSFSIGINFQKESTNIRYIQNLSGSDLLTEALGVNLQNNNRDHTFRNSGNALSLFTNFNTTYNDQFSSDFGIRFDYQNWIDDWQISPRINMSYSQGDYLFKLGFGRHYQNQFIDDVLLEDAQLKYFRPEYADLAVLELQKNVSNNYLLTAELYYKQYSDVQPYYENLFLSLHLHPQLFFDRIRLSPSSARARGVDLRLKNLNGQFNWEAVYSFSDATDDIDGQEFFRSWDQRNTFKFLMGWQYKKWQFSSLMQYHSGWPRTNLSLIDDEIIIGGRNAQRNKDYLNFDLKITYSQIKQKSKIQYWLQLLNATNRNNQCCVEYSYEENEFGQLEFETENKSWMPVIPAFGVNITF